MSEISAERRTTPRAKAGRRRVPRFIGFSMFLVALVLYFALTSSVFLILGIQSLPQIAARYPSVLEFTDQISVAAEEDASSPRLGAAGTDGEDARRGGPRVGAGATLRDQLREDFAAEGGMAFPPPTGRPAELALPDEDAPSVLLLHLFLVPIITLIGAAVVLTPFKRYLRALRKGKPVSERLASFCRKRLKLTPFLYAALILAPHVILAAIISAGAIAGVTYPEAGSATQLWRFIVVGFTAAVLQALFLFTWQRYRVQMVYLDFFFTREELEEMHQPVRLQRLSHRLWLSNVMTTFLPLIIIVTYVAWSIRPARELLELSTAELSVLLGDYATILLTVDAELGFMVGVLQWASQSLGGLWYVNAIDTVLMFAGIASGALISVMYVILLIRWTTGSIVRPVHEVLRGMERAASGKFDHHTLVRERNEIGELSIGFNRMNDQLGAYFTRVSRLNEAYYQFVPEQFLRILGRDRIEDVQLGDQTQREMTLLFSDIRSFTALTEQMTPEESFHFINDYLGAMEPAIVENDGFIDKFIGDAIMAIFDATPANAVRASLAMSRALERFNESRPDVKPVATGIGIHTGTLMLGLVGGKQRMDGTVISDAVNVASRLEGLTKHFGCRVIMSAWSAELAGDGEAWSTRPLGVVAVTGRGAPIAIVEVLDLADQADQAKARSRERFALALRKYQEGAFAPAEQIFADLLDQNPEDGPARFYLARCKAAGLQNPDEWSGVEVFASK